MPWKSLDTCSEERQKLFAENAEKINKAWTKQSEIGRKTNVCNELMRFSEKKSEINNSETSTTTSSTASTSQDKNKEPKM